MDVLPGWLSGIFLRQETGNGEQNAMPARVFTLEIATKERPNAKSLAPSNYSMFKSQTLTLMNSDSIGQSQGKLKSRTSAASFVPCCFECRDQYNRVIVV